MTALCTSCIDYFATTLSAHARTKTVSAFALNLTGLICSFHGLPSKKSGDVINIDVVLLGGAHSTVRNGLMSIKHLVP